MKTKVNNITRLAVWFFLASMLCGILNRIITGSSQTSLTPLVVLFIFYFVLSLAFFGINFFIAGIRNGLVSREFIVGLGMIVSVVCFLVVMVRGPMMGGDLNDPVNIFFGKTFLFSILIIIVGAAMNTRRG